MSMEPSSVLLTDQVAVVTGGGAGIGRGIARGSRRLRGLGGDLGTRCRDGGVGGGGGGWARPHHRRPRLGRGRCRPCPHDGRARAGTNPGEQRRGRLLLADPRDLRERLGRALPGQPQARDAVHPARGPDDGGERNGRQHHQRDLDRGCAGGPGIRGLRGGEGRGHQLHEDRRAGARPLRHPGERVGPRHHPDRGHGVSGAARSRGSVSASPFPWGAPATSTRWRAPPSSWPARCRATSRARPSMSTAGPRPRVAGTTIPRTAPTSSGRPDTADGSGLICLPARQSPHGRTCPRRWRSSAR